MNGKLSNGYSGASSKTTHHTIRFQRNPWNTAPASLTDRAFAEAINEVVCEMANDVPPDLLKLSIITEATNEVASEMAKETTSPAIAYDDASVLLEGWVQKQNRMGLWQKRWLRLTPEKVV